MSRIVISLLLTFCLMTPSLSAMDAAKKQAISDTLARQLSQTKAATHRLQILYDLFDLAPHDSVTVTGERVLEAALEVKDYASAMDMYRRLGSFNIGRDTLRIESYINGLTKLPKSPERDATECFLYLSLMTAKAHYLDEDMRYNQLMHLLQRFRDTLTQNQPIYDRVVMMFTLCNYLDAAVPGEILTSYLNELEGLIKQMPYKLNGLENMFYLHSAMVYTSNDQPARAVAADRELLQVINRLDNERIQQGRIYRNYDRFRYSVYRRMLSNYDALSDEEVEKIYRRVLELQKTNEAVADDMAHNPRVEAYYNMAKENYATALPLLMECLDKERQQHNRRQLLRLAVKAATETGDTQTLNNVAREYSVILEKTLKERTFQRGKELRALYEVAEITDPDSNQASLAERTENRNTTLTIILWIALAIIIAIVVAFSVHILRSRRLSMKLRETNALLESERDNLRRIQASLIETRDQARQANRHKSDFISNMTHEVTTPLNALVESAHLIVDNVSSEKRKYLDRFARTIDVSAEMIRTLINDVLEMNNLDSGTLLIQRATIPLNTICIAALQSMRIHTKPGVQLRWANEKEPTQVIFTDARRVEQVLVNLLSNGLKFTDEGYVELAYTVDTEAGTTTFTVTDTGIGVPEGKEEIIFERFEKLSPSSQGNGLGLSISRMIAIQLNGSLYIDTTYTGEGSRFVFTIPSLP